MMDDFVVTDVRLTPANATDQARGLVGFLQFTLDDALGFDSVTLRRTLTGAWALGFPVRSDAHGRVLPIVRPLNDATRRSITRQVVTALGLPALAVTPARAQGNSPQEGGRDR